MPHPFLNVGDGLARRALIPGPVEVLGDGAELHDQVVRKILRRDLAALFPPQPREIVLIIAHDDAGIGAADKGAPVYGVEFDDVMWRLGAMGCDRGHRYLLKV